MDAICGCHELVKLLGYEGAQSPKAVIPYVCSFPHEYIPAIVTGRERYINFDIKASIHPGNNTYKDITVFFYVFCHEAAARHEENGVTCLWYDRAACELDQIFCGTNILGVGKTILTDNEPYCPLEKFKGRLLKFSVRDFNNGSKYGK